MPSNHGTGGALVNFPDGGLLAGSPQIPRPATTA
jgi:hypothetical protein